MATIEFPKPLGDLLDGSDLQSSIRGLADCIGTILADNKLPFFPDYTDHGIDHINRVLKSEVELVPRQVWDWSKKDRDPRLLCDADAAVLIGATLLHDLGMHLRPDGFRELISKNSRFQPLPWFKDRNEGHRADRPWNELWEGYVRDARRLSESDLAEIIGEDSARVWKFHQLPEDSGMWETNHCLIVGEFIRRNHGRLAHEIAIYGFPGLPVGSGEGQFPAMGKQEGHPLMELADLIGLTARSHSMFLRTCKSYLEASPLYPGTPRPMGAAVLYSMALLRVADYLQIDRQRAPTVLLQLRNPQSPISVREWKKHRAVQSIGPAIDPRGKMVTVSKDLSLSLYLQLRELLSNMQAEIDHSTAVLDEAYGNLAELGMNNLNLATRRVHSNLESPAFRDSLPFVPERTGFSADPNLLTLLVEPLYGSEPGVGVRELIQNAVDAVSELEAWCERHGKDKESLDLPTQDGDVLIEFIRRQDATWFLRVQDKGIGMSSHTIHNYYLRAGASFRRSAEWAKEFLDDMGKPRVLRAGRFGVGAFAVFLLGPIFRLCTRHASASKSQGYAIEASTNSKLIEIHRVDGLQIGTKVEVELSLEAIKALQLEEKKRDRWNGPAEGIDWFCWDWPRVIKFVKRGGKPEALKQAFVWPARSRVVPPEWSVIQPAGFDSVRWTFKGVDAFHPLVCNGIRIARPENGLLFGGHYSWPIEDLQLKRPTLSIVDSSANLPLTIQRYGLSRETVPFINELSRDVLLSFVAHALVMGPKSRAESLSAAGGHPLRLEQFAKYGDNTSGFKDKEEIPFAFGRLRWCTTATGMVPADPWLYTLLNVDSCIVYGVLDFGGDKFFEQPVVWKNIDSRLKKTPCSLLHWNAFIRHSGGRHEEREEKAAGIPAKILEILATKGIQALGHEVEASKVMASVKNEYVFSGRRPEWPVFATYKGKKKRNVWKNDGKQGDRIFFSAKKGALAPVVPLNRVLEALETGLNKAVDESPYFSEEEIPSVLFVAEIRTRRVMRSPESGIAKLWKEFLGERAIPFNPTARAALIADAAKKPELKRHIDAWRKMKVPVND